MQMELLGQINNKEIIEKWSKLPQFIIIVGEEHSGKTYLTQYLCEKYGLFYKQMTNDIKSVKHLVDVMAPNSKTLYHFKDFHKASIQARNALLKVTEEPIEGNYIVITGASQLATLESRGRKIIMEPYYINDVLEYGSKYFENRELLENLFYCGLNTPAKIFYNRDVENIQDIFNLVQKVFNKITYLDIDDIINILMKFDLKYDGNDICLLFINMLLNYIEYNMCLKQYFSYQNPIEVLLECKYDLLRTPSLNRRMLLFSAFYELYKLRENK